MILMMIVILSSATDAIAVADTRDAENSRCAHATGCTISVAATDRIVTAAGTNEPLTH